MGSGRARLRIPPQGRAVLARLPSGAEAELVADACEMLLQDSETVRKFVQEHRSLGEKIRDWLAKWAAKLREVFGQTQRDEARALMERVEQAQKLWDKALAEAVETHRQIGNKNTATEGGVQYMAREQQSDFEKDKYFDRQIDKWSELHDGSRVKVGELNKASALNKVGFPAAGMWFDVGKIKKSMDNHSDHLTHTILKQIPKLLNDPIAITEYRGPKGDINNTVTVYGIILPDGKTPVSVGIMMVRSEGAGLLINKVRTIHARSNAQISDDNILYLNENKKEPKSGSKSAASLCR